MIEVGTKSFESLVSHTRIYRNHKSNVLRYKESNVVPLIKKAKMAI